MRSCPVDGATIRPDEALCRRCHAKLGREQRKEVGRSWHRIMSGQSSAAHLSAFGDYVREAVRLSLATRLRGDDRMA